VLCAGIAVLDMVFRVASFPTPQAKRRAEDLVATGGGCAASAAVAIARLGGRARLAAPLGGPAGADPIGDEILAGLAAEQVDCTSCVRLAGAPSPISAILVAAAGERMIVNHRDERLATARVPDPEGLAEGADLLLADNLFPEFVAPICRAFRRKGRAVVLDADKPMPAGDELPALASHVVFSAEGLRATAQCEDLAEGLRCVARRSSAFLAVTDGANDMLWLEGESLRRMPAFAVEAVDTLGAGDVFHGAFALALAEGCGAAEAMRFAAATAAIKCMRFGGGSGAPNRADVERLLARG